METVLDTRSVCSGDQSAKGLEIEHLKLINCGFLEARDLTKYKASTDNIELGSQHCFSLSLFFSFSKSVILTKIPPEL